MPLPGDQYRDTPASINPFAPPPPRISEWTAQEIATLQSKLDKQLGPEYISQRPGAGGGKVHYLAAEKVINLANDVFGFNGWSSSIQNVQLDFCDEHVQTGKITLGLSTIMRVTLRDGTFHEDIGYGHIENCKGKAAAFEKAKKEAATDALKRALRNFGNVLGNCLYDKDYLSKVTRIKTMPTKFDEVNLHRHPDFAPKPDKKEIVGAPPKRATSAQSHLSNGLAMFEDDFETNIFDDTDFTTPGISRPGDSMIKTPVQHKPGLPMDSTTPRPQLRQIGPGTVRPEVAIAVVAQHEPSNAVIAQCDTADALTGPPGASNDRTIQNEFNGAGSVQISHAQPHAALQRPSDDPQPQWNPPAPQDLPPDAPVGFVTGKAVDLLNNPSGSRPPDSALAFNTAHESPSIRRTHGVNPGKSAPVKLTAVNRAMTPGANGYNGPAVNVRTNFVNPSADPNRKVGMPAQNRSAYKPPALKRPALADVSNVLQPESDAKKAKLDMPAEQAEIVVAP